MPDSDVVMIESSSSAAFVRAHARPLDRALFAHWFEGGPAGAVEAALVPFQNADGGFGNALEPDFRLPASSVLATTIALQYLGKIDAPDTAPLVADAIHYLNATFDPAVGGWAGVPPEVNDHPRAFWWNWEGPPAAFPGNPSAEVLGWLYRYRTHATPEVLAQAERAALAAFAAATEVEWHEVLCWIRLFERAPAEVRAQLAPRLRDHVAAAVSLDPATWDEYSPRPLQFAPSPDAPFHDVVAPGIAADLDRLAGEREPDGGWSPPWSWGRYEDVWPAARADWRGVLTVQNLRTLAAYGRVRP